MATMNRRTFLAWLTGTAAGVAAAPYLDLDKLLWVPGAKTIVISPIHVCRSGLAIKALQDQLGLRTAEYQRHLDQSMAYHARLIRELIPNVYDKPPFMIWKPI